MAQETWIRFTGLSVKGLLFLVFASVMGDDVRSALESSLFCQWVKSRIAFFLFIYPEKNE
jgi:hypothetical protein